MKLHKTVLPEKTAIMKKAVKNIRVVQNSYHIHYAYNWDGRIMIRPYAPSVTLGDTSLKEGGKIAVWRMQKLVPLVEGDVTK